MKRNKLTDAMIRTAVNKAVREIREDPEKGFQSLIALGYRAFDTQIKRDFLDRAARELKNKNSVQYKLAEKLFCGADPKLVSEFGINLGYHALTDGMQELRENAEKLGSLIPWTIFFDLSWGSYPSPNIVSSLIRQGKELGIYCCLFQIDRKYSELQSLLALCAVQQDCAFVFFLEPEAITPRLLSGLLPLNNVFVFIRLGQGPVQKEKEAAELLIKNGRLCGGFRRYASQSGIPDDRTLLGQAEGLGLPLLCMMRSEKLLPPGGDDMSRFVHRCRAELKTPVLPLDLWGDIFDAGRSNQTGACLLTVSGCDQMIVTDMDKHRNTGGISMDRTLTSVLREHLKKD